jgi:hypothetical protein
MKSMNTTKRLLHRLNLRALAAVALAAVVILYGESWLLSDASVVIAESAISDGIVHALAARSGVN